MDVRIHLPPSNIRLTLFDEIEVTLNSGLKGLEAKFAPLPEKTILLGAHLLPWNAQLDHQFIFYNFEQYESPLLNNSVIDMFRRHKVWDYSLANIAWLAERGVKAKHVPIGFVPELQRIEKVTPDIDVLFYGLVNTRRRRILEDLKAAGLNVHEAINCYGAERDALISRSKIVLNMHFYETGIFEMVRCSYLFANEVCVVSESSVDVPPELEGYLTLVPYDRLVDTCITYVRYDKERVAQAKQAHKAFRACDETAILRAAIWTAS